MKGKNLLLHTIVVQSRKFTTVSGLTFQQIMSAISVETVAVGKVPHMNEADAIKDLESLVSDGRIRFENGKYYI